MTDPLHLLRAPRHASGQSPARSRLSDDILAHLGPASAVDALATATGALRKCLDDTSLTERDFTMRCAVTSKTIWEWVNELQDWPWPAEGGSGGFEMPSGKREKGSRLTLAPGREDEGFMGSLHARDVARYEHRVVAIRQDLEALGIEEIKTHVLNSHIMPLSRPGTPFLDFGRGGLAATYNKMEDISAVITAIVVRALPNLSKLSRLLQTWTLRLTVLRRVPPLLLAMEDAEVALKSGWNVVSTPSKDAEHEEAPTLTRRDFDVMKLVLEKKITKSGRSLDYMLDCLEGLGDTLPNEWLDRMEVVEQGYADWVAFCERKMREAEWAKTARLRAARKQAMNHTSPSNSNGTVPRGPGNRQVSETSEAETVVPDPRNSHGFSYTVQGADAGFDGSTDGRPPSESSQPHTPTTPNQLFSQDIDSMENTPLSTAEDGSPQLPPLHLRHMNSQSSVISQGSTVIHGISSHFGLSSDMPEVSASPDLPRNRVREAEYLQASPPSSPPVPPTDSRESSVAPFDSPLIIPRPDRDDFGSNSVFEDSFTEDFDDSFSVSELPVLDRRESTGDQHLRQQISQIIESIPAKIKLQNEPPTINLNPPDLQLPRLKQRPSADPFRRSNSSLSSRAGTPSFTLSPAKNTKARSRSRQEIKVYHLSRSTGEAPIKLFIRCVGEQGERVMVRVGGGWADLGEYLKEYASHHKRRSAGGAQTAQVEVRDLPHVPVTRGTNIGSSPPSRPTSALERTPMTPLAVRKTRRSVGALSSEKPRLLPRTPALQAPAGDDGPSSEESNRSRSSSRLSWAEDESSFLGLAGPSGKRVEMSEENKAWVESVKEKVRMVSGERKISQPDSMRQFGELGKVGGTKRLFRKSEGPVGPRK